MKMRCSRTAMAVVVAIVASVVVGHLTKIGSTSDVDETTERGSDSNCSSMKQVYGGKGFNDHDVPSQMIPGKYLVNKVCVVRSLPVKMT